VIATDRIVSRVPFRPPCVNSLDDLDFAAAIDAALRAQREGRAEAPYAACAAQLTRITGARHAELTSSGTGALLLALLAAGIGPGDEVITVANTFVATVEAVAILRATPVLVDVDERTQNIDPERVLEALTERTRAVIAVHLYGRPACLGSLPELLRERGVLLIEDASQALGAFDGDRRCGGVGDLATFSFGRTKPLAGVGEGGAVTTSDPELAQRLRAVNRHGEVDGEHLMLGVNLRMHPLEAAAVAVRLADADERLGSRTRIADRYNAALAGFGILGNSVPEPGMRHSYYVYVVTADERDALMRHLAAAGVGSARHYRVPIHRQPARLAEVRRPLPVTDRLAARILSLPLYPELSDRQVEHVGRAVAAFFEG
jgi:dTDP-4-amino-4,6-dideoxygalactose transaminase